MGSIPDGFEAESDEECEDINKGYCHFNDNELSTDFTIDLFNHSIKLTQNPAAGASLGHVCKAL